MNNGEKYTQQENTISKEELRKNRELNIRKKIRNRSLFAGFMAGVSAITIPVAAAKAVEKMEDVKNILEQDKLPWYNEAGSQVIFNEDTKEYSVNTGDDMWGIVESELGGGGDIRQAIHYIQGLEENKKIFENGRQIQPFDIIKIPTGYKIIEPLKNAFSGNKDGYEVIFPVEPVEDEIN